jgi:hypothetical protein
MSNAFITNNPQDFKLCLMWLVGTSKKMVAEFSSCRWLPRIGEKLVLPVGEADEDKAEKGVVIIMTDCSLYFL